MKILSNNECNFISGGTQDSAPILTQHGFAITAGIGGITGSVLGFCCSPIAGTIAYPIAGTIGGFVVGSFLAPIAVTLLAKGMIMSYEMTGVI